MWGILLASAVAGERPHIPEPMVFDLVRGLGARAGEIEGNTLGEVDVKGGEVSWAPEVEMALHDNVAVELELPMSGATLKAVKGAFQVTFNVPTPWFIHGAQAITEHYVAGGHEFTGLYLWGIAPKGRFSLLGMSGVRSFDGPDTPRHLEAVQNTSAFVSMGEQLALGVETNLFVDGKNTPSWLAMPQAHVRVLPGLAFQIGAGGRSDQGAFSPAVAGRLIVDGQVGGRRARGVEVVRAD